MKYCSFFLLSFIYSFSCSNSERIADTSANRGYTVSANVDTKNSDINLGVQATETPVDTRKTKNVRSFRVDLYEDNELSSSFFFRNGALTKSIGFNTQTKKREGEVKYFYEESGKFKQTKVIQGDNSKDGQLEADKATRDFVYQYDFLKSKGINFPLAEIVVDEINDVANVFSVADNYHDFETTTQADGNQKIIKFVGFNKTSRFHNSPSALLIGSGDFINIKDYELTLENGFPLKELYRTGEGDLTKTFSYRDGQLIGLVYKFTDLQNQSNSLEKRFEYHELK